MEEATGSRDGRASGHRFIYDFTEPVSGPASLELLTKGLDCCSSGLVVVRAELNDHGLSFLAALRPFTTEIADKTEWPGTRLFGHTAKVHRFVLNEESIELLESRSKAVFDWYYPDLPEDLCLLRRDGTTWFQSTVHESWAALWLAAEEAASLERL
jgi:hypothetical protein